MIRSVLFLQNCFRVVYRQLVLQSIEESENVHLFVLMGLWDHKLWLAGQVWSCVLAIIFFYMCLDLTINIMTSSLGWMDMQCFWYPKFQTQLLKRNIIKPMKRQFCGAWCHAWDVKMIMEIEKRFQLNKHWSLLKCARQLQNECGTFIQHRWGRIRR